jgi:hypothetical protein
MRRRGLKQVLLGALGGFVLLASCAREGGEHVTRTSPGAIGGGGRVGLNVVSGEIKVWTKGTERPRGHGYVTLDEEPPLELGVAVPLGTGRPLVARDGQWIQGTHGVEVGQRARGGEPGQE